MNGDLEKGKKGRGQNDHQSPEMMGAVQEPSKDLLR